MTLDIRTLSVANVLVEVVGATMLGAYASRRRTHPGFGLFVLSLVAAALAALSLGLRGPIPHLTSVVLANFFDAACALLRVDAFLTFARGRSMPRPVYVLAPAFAALQGSLATAAHSLVTRVVLVSLLGIAASVAMTWILARMRAPGSDGVRKIMAWASLALGALLAWRIGLWFVSPRSDIFSADPALAAYLAFFIVFEATQCVGIVLLNAGRLEEKLAESTTELEAARTDLGLLEGLLPICAACKSIRETDGTWSALEKYVHAHTEARFSHGVCPDCMHRLYPDYADAPPAPAGPSDGA